MDKKWFFVFLIFALLATSCEPQKPPQEPPEEAILLVTKLSFNLEWEDVRIGPTTKQIALKNNYYLRELWCIEVQYKYREEAHIARVLVAKRWPEKGYDEWFSPPFFSPVFSQDCKEYKVE